jgi:hypothetical protein
MPSVNIKSLSVPDLLTLRGDIDRMLQSRRNELESQLAQISGNATPSRRGRPKGSKVAAKYRHPETGETWSGRGGVASWLAQELKAGRKREEFLIEPEAEAKPAAAKGRRGRKPKS